jgi:hypothetical protein
MVLTLANVERPSIAAGQDDLVFALAGARTLGLCNFFGLLVGKAAGHAPLCIDKDREVPSSVVQIFD